MSALRKHRTEDTSPAHALPAPEAYEYEDDVTAEAIETLAAKPSRSCLREIGR